MSEAAPTQIGPYVPQQLLATGAHAQVWIAHGPSGEVALKIARTEAARASLIREADVLRHADHPNLVQLLDADPEGAWIALQRLRGDTIEQWARDRDLGEIVGAAVQIVDTLAYLHDQNVIHCDVKPSNVIVQQNGTAHLIDLGIATRPGDPVEGFKGTLGYAAPELLSGSPPSTATDLYGLGALLYTALTGRTPFVAPDPAALTYLPLVSLPPPPAAFRLDLPSSLNQLVLALLARDPSRRPATLARVKSTLLSWKESKPAPPILGMFEERETLRRAVVGAADGEPRVVVVYGAPGSGRRTLVAEAVEYARREGLPYLKGTDPAQALASLQSASRPAVLVMRASHKGARRLAKAAIDEGLRCLLLLHADRPVPSLAQRGAIQFTPAPLTVQDAARLAKVLGADADLAEDWWRRSMGLPAAILGRIRAAQRARDITGAPGPQLPSESRRVLAALRNLPNMRSDVSALAEELGMGEHALLDHCEVLFAEALIEPAAGGQALAVVRAREIG